MPSSTSPTVRPSRTIRWPSPRPPVRSRSPDSETLWDGLSVTDAGASRAENRSLWDIHDLDATGAFGEHATYTLSMHGQEFTDNDCLGLVVLVLDFPAGSVPPTTTTSTTIPHNPCGNGAVDPAKRATWDRRTGRRAPIVRPRAASCRLARSAG